MKHLKNIVFGQYVDLASPIHRMDPRVKFFFLVAAAVSMSVFRTSPVVIFIFLLAVIYSSGIPLEYVLANLRLFYWFFLFIGLFHIFFSPGPFFSVFGLEISREGFANALVFSFRLVVLVVASALFTMTTTPSKLTQGFERFFKPLSRLGLPVRDLAMVITVAITFIPVLFQEADRMVKAQAARGIDFSSKNILQRSRNYLSLFVPLFLNSFRRAEAMALALEIRGYTHTGDRTYMDELKLSSVDLWAAVSLGILFLCAFLGDRFLV